MTSVAPLIEKDAIVAVFPIAAVLSSELFPPPHPVTISKVQ